MVNVDKRSDKLLLNAKVVFWDFDGVIKESFEVKAQAYLDLFTEFGSEIVDCVRDRHAKDGGASRYKRIPLLFEKCAGISLNEAEIADKCELYASIVMQNVIDCSFIPGAETYLAENSNRQTFVLTTNTPKTEIDVILDRLSLRSHFSEVYGAPIEKCTVVEEWLKTNMIPPEECIFIGDSPIDQNAAKANGVPFILRRTSENVDMSIDAADMEIKDFTAFSNST